VQRQRAQADKAYEIQTNTMQQQVVVEKVKVDQVERLAMVSVQDAEIARREKELIATELKPAQINAQRIQTLAEAEKQRLSIEAAGNAEAHRRQGEAEAQVIKMKGEAEAGIIRMKGEAEAAAMDVKAKAYSGYNQAAVLDKLLTGLPEVVRAIAEPLGRVDKITVISAGGDGHGGAGVSKVTADVAAMVAQVPALVESLSGISVGEFLRNLPKLGPAIRAAEIKPPAPEAK
jgi:flotillin